MPEPLDSLIVRKFPDDIAKSLAGFATLIDDCINFTTHAFTWIDKGLAQGGGLHCSTILLLYHRILEACDGVSVLVRAGCGSQCRSHLRTCLEALMSMSYILQADTERRALAYQVSHIKRRIRSHTRNDPKTTAGREFEKLLASDALFPVKKLRPFDSAKAICNLARVLAKPEYAPIDDEFERLRKAHPKDKRLPLWHSLFGGPESVRRLAACVSLLGAYEMLYSHWSEYIHSGDVMSTVQGMNKEVQHLRDVRECQRAASLTASLVLHSTHLLLSRYAKDRQQEYVMWYKDEICQRAREFSGNEIIRIN